MADHGSSPVQVLLLQHDECIVLPSTKEMTILSTIIKLIDHLQILELPAGILCQVQIQGDRFKVRLLLLRG